MPYIVERMLIYVERCGTPSFYIAHKTYMEVTHMMTADVGNMMAPRRPSFHNEPPAGTISSQAPADAARTEFARRLQKALNEKGWNQAELARRVHQKMPNAKTGRDSISKYIRGMVLPSPRALDAMASVLGKKPDELMPTRGVPSAGAENPPFEMRDIGDNMYWLKINQGVDRKIALQIMQLLSGIENDPKKGR